MQLPSTLLRWSLIFISGVFVPLSEMAAAARAFAYLSPLAYAQDLMNHAVLGEGLLNPALDTAVLLLAGVLFLSLLSFASTRTQTGISADEFGSGGFS